MFVKLKDGRKLNLNYLSDCFQGKHDNTKVIFYLVNGVKIVEGYDTPEEVETRVQEIQESMEALRGGLVQRDTFSDLPKTGNIGTVYIAKDTGQTYYWDKKTKTYQTTGIAGRTGVYSIDAKLPPIIGTTTILNKSDLVEIVTPTVDYSDGSEVIGNNAVHAIIVGSDAATVTVKTIVDMTIDSFKQVATLDDLPAINDSNILYYVDDIDEFRVWDTVENGWVEPFHPIIFEDCDVADARVNSMYVIGKVIKYTTDNVNWVYVVYDKSEVSDNISIVFDGTSDTFDLPLDIFDGLSVTINGLHQSEGIDYTIDKTVTPNTITFDIVYDPWDVCTLEYNKIN